LRDVNCHFEEGHHGYFHPLEKPSQKIYLETILELLVFLSRMSSDDFEDCDKRIPEDLKVALNAVKNSTTDLHQFWTMLFQPFPTEPTRRGDHPVGWFVHFASKRRNEHGFVSIGAINHTLVHLTHLIRLVTYKELILKHPSIEDRKKILSMVKSRYKLLSSLFPLPSPFPLFNSSDS